ncbi:MAG: glycine cleavage system protein T [Deltaproteobacteria bacterium HGW-Deltaproteobacteria-12]|jgi:aminomethyltransferase|nr:MAG: glycine cleavage system protein T [Deltaproteobacteria bacterium HGW-Deltaproteobacteria-12]
MKKTPLYEKHVALHAKMIDFGGWAMPVQYTNVIDEHKTIRAAAGIFDICHMGEIAVRGPQALDLLQFALTRNLQKQETGQIKLSALLTDDGGIIDDLTVYKLAPDYYILVTNATTCASDWQRINELRQSREFECTVENISDKIGKLDLQGPCSQKILHALTNYDFSTLPYYHFMELKISGQPVIISRSGYTGEDGFEIYTPAAISGDLWDKLLEAGVEYGLKPAGLGARDTLRLEAGMMLNGQDITDTVSPLEVTYSWLVDLEKEFAGAAAVRALKLSGIKKKMVGLEMTGRGIARHGYKVFQGDNEIGVVTSGTFAPSLNKAIALAFVDVDCCAAGTEVSIAVRETLCPAKVVKIPFYKRLIT